MMNQDLLQAMAAMIAIAFEQQVSNPLAVLAPQGWDGAKGERREEDFGC